MKFHGFQKMTMLDYPGHVACTAFTAGCNMRCPFCHNALLVTEIDSSATIDEEEILDYLRLRKKMLDGICITGGEPLMQPEMESFIRKVKEIGLDVKLDTNGSYPALLKKLVLEGLVDYVAVDIKNRKEKYGETVGLPNFDLTPILETVEFLKEGHVPFEFRTTVVKEFHEVEDIEAIAQWISGAPRYYLQNFTDSGNLIGENLHEAGKERMEEGCKVANLYIKTETRGL